MGEYPAHLELTIDTTEPIEIGDFVAAFTSIASEYERFIKEKGTDLPSEAQIYVRQVREGSIIADLVPWIAIAAPFIADMDKMLIVEDFVRRWGSRITALIYGRLEHQPQTKSELKDFADAIAAIANDPNGSSRLDAVTFADGKREVKASIKFTTAEAREARKTITTRYKEITAKSSADHERVLMVFTRSDFNDAKVGKKSGELVRIERIASKSLPLAYASSLAEERIKDEIREADQNIYYKGFVVDVNVEMVGGKAAAFAVTDVHQVIDLPRDDAAQAQIAGPEGG